jgi:hypothetical protein
MMNEEKEDTLRTPVRVVTNFKCHALYMEFENGEHALISGKEEVERMMERITKLNER